MQPDTTTLPVEQPTGDGIHVTCCDADYAYALCGYDVSDEPIVHDGSTVTCRPCAYRDYYECAEVCPKLLFASTEAVAS